MHPQHGVGLTFSEALEQLKDGRKVTRAGWNGKDQWVVMQTGYPAGIELNHNTAQRTGLPEGSIQVFEPYYMMFTPWGSFVQWTPNAADLNADDWAIYYMPGEYERLCREATDEILADPVLVEALDASEKDPQSYSLQELKVAAAVAALESDEFPPSEREPARFRLLRQLMRPVSSKSHGEDDLTTAGIVHTFVDILTTLSGELVETRKVLDATQTKIASLEEFEKAWGTKYPIPDGLVSNDAIRAYQRIRYFQEGWSDTGGFTQTTWRLIAVLLAPMLEEWRQDLGPELGVGADGWKVMFSGLRVDGVDTIGSMTIELVPTPTAEEMQAFVGELERRLDPEATQKLVRPGDPGHPERPQRLTEVMPLRKSSPDTQGSARPLSLALADGAVVAASPQEVVVPDAPQQEAESPSGSLLRKPRYFVTYPDRVEVEVTLEQFVAAERHAGFRPKGPDVGQAATSGFSSSATNSSGRVEYVPQ